MKRVKGSSTMRRSTAWILSAALVLSACPVTAEAEELAQNIRGISDDSPLSKEEEAAMQQVRDSLGTQFCRRCNYCAPCTVGISIPSVFLFEGYLSRYGLEGWARDRYQTLEHTAGECVGCGQCETRCPYHLPIREMLKRAAKEFGK